MLLRDLTKVYISEYEEIEDIQPEYVRNYQSTNMDSKNISYIDESNSLEYNRTNKIPQIINIDFFFILSPL